jgi:hypothetical protein
MTANGEKKIIEMIEQAEVVAYPLDNLVEKAKTDVGVVFKPDVLSCLADLQKHDTAQFHQLRSELKKVGVPVAKLDKTIAQLNGGGHRHGPTQAEVLIELAGEAELFHAPDSTAYADISVDGHRQTWEISSRAFNDWLERRYFQEIDGVPSPEALKSAIRHLEARARFEAPQHDVHLRVASKDGFVYVDLADSDWRAIEIGPARWKVIENPPVRFRRAPGMLPLPEPESGAGIEELLPFLNMSKPHAVLTCHWLINTLLRGPSYPILMLQGEQGTGKSGTSRFLRAVVDPNSVPIRALPNSERDLMIAATNGHVLAFDNISTLPRWLSDALCRLSTGGGLSTRRNYTDREEELFNAVRPMILNGIGDVVTSQDLAERSLFITLEYIPDERREPEADLSARFEERRPRILGALLDAVAEGLDNFSKVRVDGLPRMADFARMAMACETAMWKPGTFEEAYSNNRDEAVEAGIDADPVAMAVRALVRSRTARTARTGNPQDPVDGCVWAGTPTDLFQDLESIKDEMGYRGAGWPKGPPALSDRLRRAEPFLRKRGIEIIRVREGRERTRMIYILDEGKKDQRLVSSSRHDTFREEKEINRRGDEPLNGGRGGGRIAIRIPGIAKSPSASSASSADPEQHPGVPVSAGGVRSDREGP